ncbi:hypothetical protein ACLBXM_02655 [Xanthobacteraceae bacterium A53D]
MPGSDPLALLQEIALLAAVMEHAAEQRETHAAEQRVTHNRLHLTHARDTGQPVRLLADPAINAAACRAIKALAAARTAHRAKELS